MTNEIKPNECPIDPECEIDAKGYHKKYHLAPAAGAKIIEKARICVYCSLDVESCKHRVDMINGDTGEIIGSNIRVVWSKGGFKIDETNL